MNLVEILSGANVALRLIQARLVSILCMVLTFVLFCWAMWLGTRLGAMIAGVWGLIIFLPVLVAGRRGYDAAPAKRPDSGEQVGDVTDPDGA